MDAKLRKLILWPKNPENPIREVNFRLTGVSVITGWSQRGKSAIIHIIDYCLGSEKCAIPVGEVRNKVAWFGIVLLTPKGEILLARKNPGDDPQSPDMLLTEAKRVIVPKYPNRNNGRDAVVERLNVLAGLPPRDISPDESSFGGPPSFRDMAAFEFQPQHIIANPYTLFFKADTTEHREKLIRSVLLTSLARSMRSRLMHKHDFVGLKAS